MNRFLTGLIALLFITLGAVAAPAFAQEKEEIAKTNLKVGEMAPDFTLLGNDWSPMKLSDFRGKKNVILAFYVLAFTGG
jgi:peroxiredoxin